MAAYRGCNGLITFGASPVGELTAWTAKAVADEIDASIMGDCTAQSVAGVKKTTGTISCNYDWEDAGQILLKIGEEDTLVIQPTGATGNTLTGEALILSVNISAEVNGLIPVEFNYSINGEFLES